MDQKLATDILTREADYNKDYLLDSEAREIHLRNSAIFFQRYGGVSLNYNSHIQSVVWDNWDDTPDYKHLYGYPLGGTANFLTGKIQIFTDSVNYAQGVNPKVTPYWSPLSYFRQVLWEASYKKTAFDKGPRQIQSSDIVKNDNGEFYFLDRAYGFLRVYSNPDPESDREIAYPALENAFALYSATRLEAMLLCNDVVWPTDSLRLGRNPEAPVRVGISRLHTLFRKYPEFYRRFLTFHSNSDVIGLNKFLANKAGVHGSDEVLYGEDVTTSLLEPDPADFNKYLDKIKTSYRLPSS